MPAKTSSGALRIFAQDPGRLRPLDIHLADPVAVIADRNRPLLLPVLEMGGHDPAHAGVDHDHIRICSQLVDNGVIDDGAVFGKEDAVDAAAGYQRGFLTAQASLQILAETVLQQVSRSFALQADDRHVAGVEDPGRLDHCQVFRLHSGWIPERHIVAAEPGHIGPLLQMPGVQLRRPQFIHDPHLSFCPCATCGQSPHRVSGTLRLKLL